MENYKRLILIVLFSLVALLGFYSGHYVTDKHWQAKWANAEVEATANQLMQVNDTVKLNNARILELEETLNETKKKLATAYLDDAVAVASSDSLQQSFTDSLRKSSNCADTSASVRELAAIATDATVQAYVFSSVVKEAVGYARIAEEAIVRGEGCQADYNTIRGKHEK